MKVDALERCVRQTANRFGIDIHRYRPENDESLRVAKMLASRGVDVVFDVGANVGQYATFLRRGGYGGRIVSFEPLTSAHGQLKAASRQDALWEVGPQAALGAEDGQIEINVAGNSVSSSALPMLESHAASAPDSGYVSTESVAVRRLDTLAAAYLRDDSVPFLKIDTQGYEDRVLAGAAQLLPRVAGVQLELSLTPLYEGQLLFDAMLARLTSQGFELWSLWPGFTDPTTGRMLQVDAVLMRAARP